MAFVAALLAVVLCAFAGHASAFDTGPHFDITEDVLQSEGFSPTAIKTAQTANFLVDFYEFIGNPAIKSILDGDCRTRVEPILKSGDAQHFDDLTSTTAVAQKWDTMLDATKRGAEARAKSGEILGLLALLGASLHNVQDFYAHSNWVEAAPNGPGLGGGALAKYGDHPTWLSVDRSEREAMDVYTKLDRPSIQRKHGDWDSDSVALNKDWAGRPFHRDAYICAYFASRQWVRLFRSFVSDPAVWNKMQHAGTALFDPSRDWDYARKISFYGGHWNGNGGPTGLKDAFSSRTAGTSPDLLAAAVVNYMGGRCISKNPSALRKEIEQLLLTWGAAPYRAPLNPALPSPAPENLQFVRLRVEKIDATDADDGLGGGDLDWYSRAMIGQQRYWSGLIDEHDNFDFLKPPYAPWTMTKALPTTVAQIPIMLQLMELDYKDDDLIDINPKSGDLGIVFSYATATGQIRGDVTGTSTFTTQGKGDCDCARVKVSVDRVVAASLR